MQGCETRDLKPITGTELNTANSWLGVNVVWGAEQDNSILEGEEKKEKPSLKQADLKIMATL